jgi:hypothetical protein
MWRYFKKVGSIYNRTIRGHREEPRFLIITSFTITFLAARLSVYNIRYHFIPFLFSQNLFVRDIHIHHLVFGIFLLLIAGLIRIPQFEKGLIRVSSILYGMGAALTLDEFALWLRLNPDVYFGRDGRISIDAVVLFFLIVLSSLWHGAFWRKLFHYTIRYVFFRKGKKSSKLHI